VGAQLEREFEVSAAERALEQSVVAGARAKRFSAACDARKIVARAIRVALTEDPDDASSASPRVQYPERQEVTELQEAYRALAALRGEGRPDVKDVRQVKAQQPARASNTGRLALPIRNVQYDTVREAREALRVPTPRVRFYDSRSAIAA